MKWKFYWRDIVSKYCVRIVRWPSDIPLGNLSDVATLLPVLECLQRLWSTEKITFQALSEDEFHKLDEECNNEIENGDVDLPAPRKIRSDKGKKRKRGDKGEGPQKKVKSRVVVDSETDGSDKENDLIPTWKQKHHEASVASKGNVDRDSDDDDEGTGEGENGNGTGTNEDGEDGEESA